MTQASKNVLVTGGCGFIGSHTCCELIESGYTPIIIDNFSNSHPLVLDRIQEITGYKPKLYQGDVRDSRLLDTIFTDQSIDFVIHFAALKAVGESVEKPLEYYNNNLGGLMSLLDALIKHGCTKLVFSSSATVYGDQSTMPLVESQARSQATNPYGQTKLMAEIMLEDIARAYPQMSIVLLRYFNPIGAHPSGLIGEDPQGIPNNLMPYITQVASKKLDYLRVFGNDYNTPDGTGVRDYIHISDLAKGHVQSLDWMSDKTGVEIFNLGTGQGYSVLELLHSLEEVIGQEIPYKIVDRRPGDVAICYSDPSKAYEYMGWKTQYDVHDMCRDAWNWQSNNPHGFEA